MTQIWWTKIRVREPARGQQVLLFFPRSMRRGQVALEACVMTGQWPWSAPRRPTLWAPIPVVPANQPWVDYDTQEEIVP